MALEQQIIDWSATRPAWQRAVLRRVAVGESLSDQEYDQLISDLVGAKPTPATSFGLEHLPQIEAGDPPVTLVSIENPEHVNALASDKPLTFEPTGITIIYGDNGSGKSGYARLLKRIARARHREDVLSDVFRDTVLAKPRAALKTKIGDIEHSFSWPDSVKPELQRMLYYDERCGDAYIATESDFPYRPSALFVLDGLIDISVEIRRRVDARLEDNARTAKPLPVVADEVKDSNAGKYLTGLSGQSSLAVLDALTSTPGASTDTINDLKNDEARLRIADTTKESQALSRQVSKIEALLTHLKDLDEALNEDVIAALESERNRVRSLEEAVDALATSFHAEPLGGVGTPAWKELWESARQFSEAHAYPDERFPKLDDGSRCVLCQQLLEGETRDRLSRFEQFVHEATQTALRDLRAGWDAGVQNLSNLCTTTEAVEINLKDVEPSHGDLVRDIRALLAAYEAARSNVLGALGGSEYVPRSGISPDETATSLERAAAAGRNAIEGLSNPENVTRRLTEITARRKELELLQEFRSNRDMIANEIGRLKERDALEAVKAAAATGPITNKILELSEENITEVVRDAFTRETERLHLERVTIAKTRAERGALLHQPKLVGARQDVTLPRVLSEGERTALGLAAYFTEADLDASKSALILDDPVSSLDHIRRQRVAERIASFADARQVVIFTHDAAFVADLKREAKGRGVAVGERSVSRGRGTERKPGVCTSGHPWKAKDVAERLGDLRTQLARIKRESVDCDDATYEKEVATWAGSLSETWERIFSQEVVGPVLAEGGLEVRPSMMKVLVSFSAVDDREFQASYSRVSQWAKRHDKSGIVNYVAPETSTLEEELARVDTWFRRVRGYKN